MMNLNVCISSITILSSVTFIYSFLFRLYDRWVDDVNDFSKLGSLILTEVPAIEGC